MPQWRVTLDVPYSFAIENGFRRDVKSGDFRNERVSTPGTGATANLWREPINGIVMFRPSTMSRGFTEDFKGLSSWNYRTAFWQEVKRAQALKNYPNPAPADPDQKFALLMAPVKPAGQRFELIELLIEQAIIAIEEDLENYDRMKWVLESTFTLAEDESFAIHYHGLTDEMVRKNNWFCLAWDNIGLHFSHTGLMRVYRYDRSDKTKKPDFLQEVEICSPAEILNRAGYFWFIPIPNLGLAVYHGLQRQKEDLFGASAQVYAVRGKLIPWNTLIDGDGHAFLFEASTMRIGMNPYHPTLIGFQNIRFPVGSGSFVDGTFPIPYKPILAPTSVVANGVADRGTLSAAVKDPDGSSDWKPGTDRARVAITLSTGDAKYTPFSGTYSIYWEPHFATRDTTPLVLASKAEDGADRLMRLEWADDADSHFEGKIEMILHSAAGRKIARRGDATFLLEYSTDGGATWFTFTGGLVRHWKNELEYSPNWGSYMRCKAELADMWGRLDESHVLWQQSFDSLSIADSLNNVFTTSGFAPIADADLPDETKTTKLAPSPDGGSWRYSPRERDMAQDVIGMLLVYLRRQNVAYRARFDWPNAKWILEKRPRDVSSIWTIQPFAILRNESSQTWDYSSIVFEPFPPEGNQIICEGLTAPSPNQRPLRITEAAQSYESIFNHDSLDYLGRMVTVKLNFPEVTERDVIKAMTRRVYDAIAFHRDKATIETMHFTFGLAPNQRVRVYDVDATLLLDTWIKRRTVVIEQADQETVKYETDDVWQEPMTVN